MTYKELKEKLEAVGVDDNDEIYFNAYIEDYGNSDVKIERIYSTKNSFWIDLTNENI